MLLWVYILSGSILTGACGAADGNIHASEPTGAHCAVYNALHLLEEEPELLKRIAVYIVPRVAVDGAEFCVTTGGRVRSRKWEYVHQKPPVALSVIDGPIKLQHALQITKKACFKHTMGLF